MLTNAAANKATYLFHFGAPVVHVQHDNYALAVAC